MVKKYFSKVTPIIVLLLLATACERKGRPYGFNYSKGENSPQYKTEASISEVAKNTHVKEVAVQDGPKKADGKEVYTKICSACHQANGQGVPGAFPPLDNSKYVTSDNHQRLASIIVYGLNGPINVNGTTYNSVMAPWGTLSDDEITAVMNYIRSSWSNKAPAVAETVVKEVRTKYGSRGSFTIAELGEEQ